MTRGDFGILFDTLERAYRIKDLPEQKINRYWQKARYLTREDFKLVIDRIIDDCKHFPTPQELGVVIRDLDLKGQSVKAKGPTSCPFCFTTGVVVAEHEGHEYCFKCSCHWGRPYPDAYYQVWQNDRYTSMGYRVVYQSA